MVGTSNFVETIIRAIFGKNEEYSVNFLARTTEDLKNAKVAPHIFSRVELQFEEKDNGHLLLPLNPITAIVFFFLHFHLPFSPSPLLLLLLPDSRVPSFDYLLLTEQNLGVLGTDPSKGRNTGKGCGLILTALSLPPCEFWLSSPFPIDPSNA